MGATFYLGSIMSKPSSTRSQEKREFQTEVSHCFVRVSKQRNKMPLDLRAEITTQMLALPTIDPTPAGNSGAAAS